MNYKMIRYILGKLLGIEAVVLMIPMFVSFIYREDVVPFLVTILILVSIYFLLALNKPKNQSIYAKDGFILVAASWLLWSLFGALPYWLGHSIPSIIDAFFESVSGFTTTGATILTNIEALPNGLLFWRSMSHWIGGMGVLVFVLVFIPVVDKKSMYLMRAEVPGPSVDKLVPKVRSTAKILYGIYFILSVILLLLLLSGGMSLFDSFIHMFSTAGTGGFSSHSDSIGYFNSAYIDAVIAIFMILFGINFNVFYFIIMKKFSNVFKNEELKVYLGIIMTSAILIAINIYSFYGSALKSFRYAFFQVASVITTTGYATADYDLWPEFSKTIIIILISVGACAGSTGGGIKVSRWVIFFKTIGNEVKRILHPQAINIIKIDKKSVDQDITNGVYTFFVTHVLIFVFALLIISLDKFDFSTNFTAVLTTFNNVGPGIGGVGPTQNFALFSDLSKFVFCMIMLIGRLEIFPFLILFSPFLWRKKF